MSSDEKDTSPDVDAAPETTASKRKANVEEIEVNLDAPEPPSKRARRAMKKGKSVTSKSKRDNDNDKADLEDNDDDNDADDAATATKRGDKPARSEHGVWIGNLRFTVTPQELRKWLVDNSGGAITEAMMTRVNLPLAKSTTATTAPRPPAATTPRRDNRGFAYVDFSDVAGKVAALALSETELHGRRLLIKDARSFEGRPKKEETTKTATTATTTERGSKNSGQAAAEAGSRKIFVGNMSFQTTEDDVTRNFARCGEIEWVKMATFEDSGKCKGYGWVKFREPEAAAWAVRGFVKIKEPVVTEDDFLAEQAGGDDIEQEGEGQHKDEEKEESRDGKENKDDKKADKTPVKKKTKTRTGPEKQFTTRKWYVNHLLGRELKLELAEDDKVRYRKRFGKDRPAERRQQQQKTETDKKESVQHEPPAEVVDIQEARLMGKLVKHTGTKVTF